jgi:type 1 fimbria pilin
MTAPTFGRMLRWALVLVVTLTASLALTTPAQAATCTPQHSSILGVGPRTVAYAGGVWHLTNTEVVDSPCSIKANQLHIPGQLTGVVGLALFANPGGGFQGVTGTHIVNRNDSAFITWGSFQNGFTFAFAVFEGQMGGTTWAPGCPPNFPGPCTYNGYWG